MKIPGLLLIFWSVALAASQVVAEEKQQEETKADEKVTAEKLRSSADIQLESTFVGDKEQPAVSYFIPWQGTSAPDKLQWNMEQKHDATLQLIDRDVMVRSINIYEEMDMEKGN